MTLYLPQLDADNLEFPDISLALDEPNGLLAFGGDLSKERLIMAYQQGIFPWFSHNEPILWWSPAPRAVFDPKTFKPAKSLQKFQRKHQYKISINHATEQIINLCADSRSESETWITAEMKQAYVELAKYGRCHSVEVWEDDALIGGLYGISVGTVFCGESMVSLKTNASKVALWHFCLHFVKHHGTLIDCQIMNPHLESLGASELSRDAFLEHLVQGRQQQLSTNCFQPQWL
ncbi:leucyl/phenylalanyl-tRNA--protein transferase [Vibrio gallicus]|uniref:leucyl/phenylalanyl-tRNA--protein transferase n=1 Tax=Vibrio gallicus TaxID=190897 RepID=UPI0021C4BF5D|nr:leucyl/phenylalanyl-tRNA--protein transferase [Vibrio gallicus]